MLTCQNCDHNKSTPHGPRCTLKKGQPCEYRDQFFAANKKPYEAHCTGCGHFRRNCTYKDGFCLLRGRPELAGKTLLQMWDDGMPCPHPDGERWPPRKRTDEQTDPDGLVSVIILAKNEPILQQTIDNLRDTARGPVEFIVMLDGAETAEPRLDADVTVIRHANAGRRPSTNKAVKLAQGKYLFHIDAHVKTETIGWDLQLKAGCADDHTMVIPSLDKLKLQEYRCCGRRFGHKYITHKMKDAWSGIKPVQKFEETICGNGMGWFLRTDYYHALGGCDEEYGRVWGNFGLEWALKVWLTDPDGRGPGRVLLSRDVVFAHMWKNDVGYKTPGVDDGRKKLFEFVDGTAKHQVRPFYFFEKHLGRLIPMDETGDKAPLLMRRPAVTAVMNTNGMYTELIAEAVESFLRQDYPNKKLLIVNTHAAPLKIKNAPPEIEIHNIRPFERFPQQIQYAIKQVQTPCWCIMDTDDIFFSRHISQLVNCYNDAKDKQTPSPFYVCVPKAWEQWAGGERKPRHRGWWCCLFERPTDEQIDEAFDTFLGKHDRDTGSDLHFIKRPWWTRVDYEQTEITVLHRLGIGFHIGHAPKDLGSGQHYKNGIAATRQGTLPEIVPGWRMDYEAACGYEKRFEIRIKNHLGDAVCAEPAIRNLKIQHPAARIRVYSKFPEVFKDNPFIEASLRLAECRGPVTHELKVRRGKHLTDWLTPGAEWRTDRRPVIYADAEVSRFEIDFGRPTAVISTRTNAVHKRWNREKWGQLVRRLREMGYQTVQVGVAEKAVGCDYNLSDKTTLAELIGICRRAALYVGIDAGVQHIAAAVGTPGVVLFGPADPDTVVHDGMTTAVTSDVCRDCWAAERIGRKCPKGDAVCMFAITVEQVIAAVKKCLTRHRKDQNVA